MTKQSFVVDCFELSLQYTLLPIYHFFSADKNNKSDKVWFTVIDCDKIGLRVHDFVRFYQV